MPLRLLPEANAGIALERLRHLQDENPARRQVEKQAPMWQSEKLSTGSRLHKTATKVTDRAGVSGLPREPLLAAPMFPPRETGSDINFYPELGGLDKTNCYFFPFKLSESAKKKGGNRFQTLAIWWRVRPSNQIARFWRTISKVDRDDSFEQQGRFPLHPSIVHDK